MSISIDPNDVRALQQVSAFFNFIQNPEQYKVLVKDVNATLDKMLKVTDFYTNVADFNQKSAQEYVAIEAKKVQLDDAIAAFELDVGKRNAALVNREFAVDIDAANVASDRIALNLAIKDYGDRNDALILCEEKLAKDLDIYNDRNAALTKAEKELTDLREKLNAALGAL